MQLIFSTARMVYYHAKLLRKLCTKLNGPQVLSCAFHLNKSTKLILSESNI